jgi:hypothetical protein
MNRTPRLKVGSALTLNHYLVLKSDFPNKGHLFCADAPPRPPHTRAPLLGGAVAWPHNLAKGGAGMMVEIVAVAMTVVGVTTIMVSTVLGVGG